jgi:hypothetical protein
MKKPFKFMLYVALWSSVLAISARAETVTVTATQGKTGCMDLTVSSVAGAVQAESRLKTRNSTTTCNKSWFQFDLTDIYASNPV